MVPRLGAPWPPPTPCCGAPTAVAWAGLLGCCMHSPPPLPSPPLRPATQGTHSGGWRSTPWEQGHRRGAWPRAPALCATLPLLLLRCAGARRHHLGGHAPAEGWFTAWGGTDARCDSRPVSSARRARRGVMPQPPRVLHGRWWERDYRSCSCMRRVCVCVGTGVRTGACYKGSGTGGALSEYHSSALALICMQAGSVPSWADRRPCRRTAPARRASKDAHGPHDNDGAM